MLIDPRACDQAAISVVDMTDEGYYKDRENEILFATYSIFRILRMNMIKDAGRSPMWEVHLTLVRENDQEMSELTRHVRKEMGSRIGWSRLGWIFWKIGQCEKAEGLYQVLLDKASSNTERTDYLHCRGLVCDNMDEYSRALSYYERSLEIRKVALLPNHPDFAQSYNSIELVYKNMDEYSKALSSYERSLEIRKVALFPNHLDSDQSYNNIGLVYVDMGEYSKALSYLQKAHDIHVKVLPATHPHRIGTKGSIERVKKMLSK